MADLQELGFTINETKVYGAMLSLKASSIDKITKTSHVSRRNVYDALNRLVQRGLISVVGSDGKTLFEAVSPLNLKTMFEQEQAEKANVLNIILPSLLSKFNQKTDEVSTRIFKGKMGIKASYNPLFEVRGEIVAFGASKEFFEIMGFYAELVQKRREQLKIPSRIIFRHESLSVGSPEDPLTKWRMLPKGYSPPLTIATFGNFSNLYLWGEEPVAVQIESKQISQAFREYFELLWSISTDIK